MNNYEIFADELDALRAERISIEDLWHRYGNEAQAWMRDMTTILSFVEHYVTDDDIRAKDPDYRSMQEDEFDRLLSYLRSGKIAEAKRITFLGSTG